MAANVRSIKIEHEIYTNLPTGQLFVDSDGIVYSGNFDGSGSPGERGPTGLQGADGSSGSQWDPGLTSK